MTTRWLPLLGLLLTTAACEEVTGPAGYLATFDDVAGLKAGAPVYVAGVKVGRIKSVALDEGRAKVEFLVEGQSGVQVSSGTCASVGRYAFEPDAHLRLEPKEGTPIESGGELTCVDEHEPDRIDDVAERAYQLVDGMVQGKGTVGRLLRDEALADKVVAFFSEPPAPKGTDEPAAVEEAGDEPEGAAEAPAMGDDKPDGGAAAPKGPPRSASPDDHGF